MNLLFLTLLDFSNLDERNIYTDLLREFYRHGHTVCVVSPVERRKKAKTKEIVTDERLRIIKPRIGNMQKTNVIEKGISTLTLESKIVAAIKKYYANIQFDLVLYSTPPITLQKAVSYVKKRDNATTYLMLKDIFPQNAVDLEMLSTAGIKGILYKYFRFKEKKLYRTSDYIGCMSQANVDYVLDHNPEIVASKVEICPNSIELQNMDISVKEKIEMRNKYGIPLESKIFVYGGNLGKPQGIDFMIDCMRSQTKNAGVFFLIVGAGTEYSKIEKFINQEKPINVKLMKQLPKEDYDRMVASCDIGMIFLDYRFTIPNFPSRLLSYMQAQLPVLAVTDVNTDVGKVITEGGFGWWCASGDRNRFDEIISSILSADEYSICSMKNNEINYLQKHYTSNVSYEVILKKISC